MPLMNGASAMPKRAARRWGHNSLRGLELVGNKERSCAREGLCKYTPQLCNGSGRRWRGRSITGGPEKFLASKRACTGAAPNLCALPYFIFGLFPGYGDSVCGVFLTGGGQFLIDDLLEDVRGLSPSEKSAVDEESGRTHNARTGPQLYILVDLSLESPAAQAAVERLLVQL